MATIEEHLEQQKLVLRPKKKADPVPHDEAEEEEAEDIENSEEEEDEPLEFNPPPKAPPPPRYAAPPPPPPFKKIETLEDLYHFFPNIGDGSFYLRVERVQPKSYDGYPAAGFLGDYHERMTLPEFQERFGGGKYTVYVMGPVKSRDDGVHGPIRALASVDLQIPGLPSRVWPQQFGEDQMMNMPRGAYPFQEHPNVAAKRLEIEAKVQERAEEERKRMWEQAQLGATAPEHVVRAFSAQSDKALTEIKSQAEQSVLLLREQQKAMLIEIGKKEDELRELRNELVKSKTEASESNRKFEQDLRHTLFTQHQTEVATLKEQFNRETSQLRDAQKREVEQLEKTNKERMDELSRRYGEDLNRRDLDARGERERIQREAERSEKSLKDTYDSRISDLIRTTEREIATVRDQRDREISSFKSTYESSEKFTKQTAEVRIDVMNQEIVRLRTETESLKRENESLRKAAHKDPVTFLRETREFASEHLGMVTAGEKEEDGEFDWKKEGAKAVVGLLQKAPEIAKNVSETVMQQREQNRMMVAQQQQAMAEAQQNPRGLPMGPGSQRRRHVAPTPWSGNMHTPIAPEIAFKPPIPHRIVVQTQAEADAIINGTAPVPSEPVAQPVQPQAAIVQQTAPVVQPQPPPVQQQQPSPEEVQAMHAAIEQFIAQLEEAIRGEIVTPAMFAKAIIDHVGPEQASQLLQQVPVEKFLESMQQQDGGKGAAISTREGRQYVREVWREGSKMLGG